MIWFILLVPLAATICLAIFAHKKMDWWEYALQFALPVLLIFGAKHYAVKSMTEDKEYWNNYAVSANYDEPWNEYIHKTCTRTVSCGKNCSTTQTYDCSYVDNHPAKWYLYDNGGRTHSISKSYYSMLKGIWKNEKFKDMRRRYHTYDGDRYTTLWNRKVDLASIVPVTTTHKYENKVQVPNELFNYQEVDSATIAEYGLYDYNWGYDKFSYNPIKGGGNNLASKILAMNNAFNGLHRQLHMEILVFDGKPSIAGEYQEAYWKGGNKNEFVISIGKKDGKIEWVNVFSWTTNEVLKVEVRDYIVSMETYDIRKIVDYVVATVPKKFKRRDFKEFSYIKVDPSNTAILYTLLATILLSIGLAIYHIKNEWGHGGRRYSRW
jgi:hypothetical protein